MATHFGSQVSRTSLSHPRRYRCRAECALLARGTRSAVADESASEERTATKTTRFASASPALHSMCGHGQPDRAYYCRFRCSRERHSDAMDKWSAFSERITKLKPIR